MTSPLRIKPTNSLWSGRIISLIALSIAALGMLYLSWGKWPDVLIDFGRELYVPWMLVEGKVLYRDLLYFRGPLSPYWNALWFYLFGPGFNTVVWVNLALLSIMMVVMYRLLRLVSSPFAAFFACLVFILLFAFNQYVGIGNYNYVCPYAHEATHGMLLSWMSLACLVAHLRSGRSFWLAGAGLFLGMVFLTKSELFVAAAAATLVAIGFWIHQTRPASGLIIKSISIFTAAVSVPPVIAFFLLNSALSWPGAAMGTLGEWWYLGNSQVFNLSFYRAGMGIDAPVENFMIMLMVMGVYAVIFMPAWIMARSLHNYRLAWIIAGLEVAALVALAFVYWWDLPWFEAFRPLPLLLLMIGVWRTLPCNQKIPHERMAGVVLIVFSLVLLGKIFLNARIHHYGFILAMPATLIVVVALLDWIPDAIERKGGRPLIFTMISLVVLAILIVRYGDVSAMRYERKSVVLGTGGDTFLADQRGLFVKEAVGWLKSHANADDTMAVLPEGIMVNYLARLKNSTPIVTAIPSDFMMYGEEPLLTMFQEAPPMYIALVHRDDTEYGYRFFGREYGRKIGHWITENYDKAYLIGSLPLRDERFGILIYKRK